MLQKIRQIHKKVAVIVVASTLALVAGGIGMLYAQNGSEQAAGRHEPAPIWEQVDRQIAINPTRPTPPEVQADLVSLKVTYRNFDKQTKYGIVEVYHELKEDVIAFFKMAWVERVTSIRAGIPTLLWMIKATHLYSPKAPTGMWARRAHCTATMHSCSS